MQDYKEIIAEILIDEKTLQARIQETGRNRSAATTKARTCCSSASCAAASSFMVDLMRHITVPHAVDFMALTSYGVGGGPPAATSA